MKGDSLQLRALSLLLLSPPAPSDPATSAHPPPSCLLRVTKEALGVSIHRLQARKPRLQEHRRALHTGNEPVSHTAQGRTGGSGLLQAAFSAPGGRPTALHGLPTNSPPLAQVPVQ